MLQHLLVHHPSDLVSFLLEGFDFTLLDVVGAYDPPLAHEDDQGVEAQVQYSRHNAAGADQ